MFEIEVLEEELPAEWGESKWMVSLEVIQNRFAEQEMNQHAAAKAHEHAR